MENRSQIIERCFDASCCADTLSNIRVAGESENGEGMVHYDPVFDEFGLYVPDRGTSFIVIQFCPWCGRKLPESKRYAWYDELEKLGYDSPLEQDIPQEYRTDQWYKRRVKDP